MRNQKMQMVFKLACLGAAALIGNATTGCIGPAESYILLDGETKTRYVPIPFPLFLPLPFPHHHHHHHCHGSVTKPATVF